MKRFVFVALDDVVGAHGARLGACAAFAARGRAGARGERDPDADGYLDVRAQRLPQHGVPMKLGI
jgi:hypothetical protein